MSDRLRRAAGAALLPSVALGVAVVLLPGRIELAVHVWLLVVLSIGLLALVAGIRQDVPPSASRFAAAIQRPPARTARPPSLARVEREVSMGAETAFDTHYRLRPLFRTLTAGILLNRFGVDLERSPERARELVGDDLWALVEPGLPAPEDRGAAGTSHPTIERAVADLERVAWS